MLKLLAFMLLGTFAGFASGLIGIGGGIIIVPALIFIFGFSQHLAQGTTLALLVPPIGFLAAYIYYKQGYVNFSAAAIICLGFFIGGYLGSKYAVGISNETLRKIFGIGMIIIGSYMTIK